MNYETIEEELEDEEESYAAFLFDNYGDKDYTDYDLIAHDDERRVNWDNDDYEYYDAEEDYTDPGWE